MGDVYEIWSVDLSGKVVIWDVRTQKPRHFLHLKTTVTSVGECEGKEVWFGTREGHILRYDSRKRVPLPLLASVQCGDADSEITGIMGGEWGVWSVSLDQSVTEWRFREK